MVKMTTTNGEMASPWEKVLIEIVRSVAQERGFESATITFDSGVLTVVVGDHYKAVTLPEAIPEAIPDGLMVSIANAVFDVFMASEDGQKITTTNGEPVEKVRAEQTNETGQHAGYIVLDVEERAKGLVRPLRDS